MLHLISKNPVNIERWTTRLSTLQENDAVVLLNDACYLLSKSPFSEFVKQIATHSALFFISEDAAHRGISIEKARLQAEPIDFDGLVVLSEKHNPIVHWNVE